MSRLTGQARHTGDGLTSATYPGHLLGDLSGTGKEVVRGPGLTTSSVLTPIFVEES